MKTLTLLIAAIGVLVIQVVRPAPRVDDEDEIGLFIGSARPLAAKPAIPGRRR